jgi:SAM-dependent methyltransferase
MLCSDGSVHSLSVDRWLGEASDDECALLAKIRGPVLDIGCGPGRHVVALASRGIPALGIDVSDVAVTLAGRRGAPVLNRSVFERIPGAGRWGTALLLDGSIGIGGSPVRLLRRVNELLLDRGSALIEVDRPGVGCKTTTAQIATNGEVSEPFPWARLGVDALDGVAASAGFAVTAVDNNEDRWFARLSVRSPG